MLNAVVGGSMGVCLFSLSVSVELDCLVPVEYFAALPDVARSWVSHMNTIQTISQVPWGWHVCVAYCMTNRKSCGQNYHGGICGENVFRINLTFLDNSLILQRETILSNPFWKMIPNPWPNPFSFSRMLPLTSGCMSLISPWPSASARNTSIRSSLTTRMADPHCELPNLGYYVQSGTSYWT